MRRTDYIVSPEFVVVNESDLNEDFKIKKDSIERMKGVEPSSPAWKAGVIAVIRHPLYRVLHAHFVLRMIFIPKKRSPCQYIQKKNYGI